jgi:hypothetical protein
MNVTDIAGLEKRVGGGGYEREWTGFLGRTFVCQKFGLRSLKDVLFEG